MNEKRLAEIQARKAEILKEIADADEARVKALNDEVDGLNKEEKELRAKTDLAGKLTPMDNGGKPADKDAEERAAEIKKSGRMTLTAAEVRSGLRLVQRSTLIASDSLAKPTGTGTNIEDTFNVVSSIVDQVRVMNCEGCSEWDEPYVKANSTAAAGTDGTAPTPSDPTFRVAAIKPNLVNVMSYVSKNIEKLTPVAYADKVREIALVALRSKVGSYIPNGDGSTFYGIKTAVNTKAENIFATLDMTVSSTKGVIDEKTLRKIVMNYGGDENIGTNARLFLNKTDLIAFGDVRGSTEKKAVYEITPDASNPNTGIIKDGGLSVPYTINSSLTALSGTAQTASAISTMLYGDPMNYELGLFGDYTIEVSKDYKFGEGLLTVLGEVMAGGNLIKHNGFMICQIPATA